MEQLAYDIEDKVAIAKRSVQKVFHGRCGTSLSRVPYPSLNKEKSVEKVKFISLVISMIH